MGKFTSTMFLKLKMIVCVFSAVVAAIVDVDGCGDSGEGAFCYFIMWKRLVNLMEQEYCNKILHRKKVFQKHAHFIVNVQ